MTSTELFSIAASWLLTYAVHSTLFLFGAWLIADRVLVRSMVAKDTIWKVALVGGLLTSTAQVFAGFEPFTGRYEVAAAAPTAIPAATANDVGTSPPSDGGISFEPTVDTPIPAPANVPTLETAETPAARVDAPVAASSPTVVDRIRPILAEVHWASALMVLWGIGALVGLGRFAIARTQVWRLLRDRRVIQDPDLLNMVQTLSRVAGLRQRIRLTWSPTITTPVAFRSEICLPRRALSEMSREHHRAILAHEVAHIARRDPVWVGVGLMVQRIFFFQPLNGLGRRRMTDIAEYLCDDWAVTHTGTKLTFAESLAEVATWISRAQRPALLTTMAEDGSQLVRRVERILDAKASPTDWAQHRLRIPTAAAALVAIGGIAPGISYGALSVVADAPAAVDPTASELAVTVAAPRRDAATQAIPNDSVQQAGALADTVALTVQRAPATISTQARDTLAIDEASDTLVTSGLDQESDSLAVSTPDRESDTLVASALKPAPSEPEQQSADTAVVNSLIRATRDEDADVRREAVNALGTLASPLAIPALIVTLQDENADVRYRAAEALGKIPDPRSVEPLAMALRDSSSRVRQYAAAALGRSGNARAHVLIAGVLDDENPAVRLTAVRVLGRIKNPESIDALSAAIGDPSENVREYAIRALGSIGDARVTPAVIPALRDDSTDVREAAVRALGEFKDARAVTPLIASLDDADGDVREAAIRSLRVIGDPVAVPPIIGRLDDESNDVREYAVRALADFEDPRALTPLIGRLQDPDPDVREVTAQALDDFKDASVVPPLIGALTDTVADVQEAAIRSLTALEDPRAIGPLTDRMQDPNPAIRTLAARALHEFEDPRVVPALIPLLDDTSASVRVGALHSLEELEDPRGVEPTIRLLTDPSPNVRGAASRVLAVLKDTRAIDPLIAAASDSVPEVRGQALRALVSMRNARAVPALITALQDESVGLRRSAARWLGSMRDPRGVDPLIAALQDEDSDVRAAAARALAQIGNR